MYQHRLGRELDNITPSPSFVSHPFLCVCVSSTIISRRTWVVHDRCRVRAPGIRPSSYHPSMKRDAAAVQCTRASFAHGARQLCAGSPWVFRSKRDVLGESVEWLEATYNLGSSLGKSADAVLTTVCILFNADFMVPQLGFYNSSHTSLADLRVAVPNLSFLNAPSMVAPTEVMEASPRPLVSFSWCQELDQHMWLMHPCDTENMLRCRRYDGERGDVLTVFLRAVSEYFPLAPALIPQAAGSDRIAHT
ncbi:hypothetical protein LSCM1_01628 [Leishmania martiniquensis]|uniref:Autophagy protein 10 (ATG10) n=1 Tax=Leishmania martiniquensis TaxID=1580590 RepID=A0A836GG56_9TRYP|nr:hypothetical protein LSCM1_01628 [Leishmania martiniquensis]